MKDAARLAARLAAGAVLIYAGASKAAAPPEEFALVLSAYRVLPKDLLPAAAAFLPWVELLAGWALVLGAAARPAALAAAGLFAAFLASLLSVLARGIELPSCGCFGAALRLAPAQTAALDAALLALCLWAWRRGPGAWSLDEWASRGYTGRR